MTGEDINAHYYATELERQKHEARVSFGVAALIIGVIIGVFLLIFGAVQFHHIVTHSHEHCVRYDVRLGSSYDDCVTTWNHEAFNVSPEFE